MSSCIGLQSQISPKRKLSSRKLTAVTIAKFIGGSGISYGKKPGTHSQFFVYIRSRTWHKIWLDRVTNNFKLSSKSFACMVSAYSRTSTHQDQRLVLCYFIEGSVIYIHLCYSLPYICTRYSKSFFFTTWTGKLLRCLGLWGLSLTMVCPVAGVWRSNMYMWGELD